MPLLMCPNDNSPMQTLDRAGVHFDMCPACRGVWLDRGELEKLMAAAAEEATAAAAPRPAPPPQPQAQPGYAPPPQQPWGQPQPYRSDDRHYGHGYGHGGYYKKKKKGMDIFDIFD